MPCVTPASGLGMGSEPFQVLSSAQSRSCGELQHAWGALTLYYYYFNSETSCLVYLRRVWL